jgi:hypothetical protein
MEENSLMTGAKVVVESNGKKYPTCMFNKPCPESLMKRVNANDHRKKRLAKLCTLPSTCNQQQWTPTRKEDILLVQEFVNIESVKGVE